MEAGSWSKHVYTHEDDNKLNVAMHRLVPGFAGSSRESIFMVNAFGSLIKIDKDDKCVEINDKARANIDIRGAKAIIINDEFHLIGGYRNNHHWKWNGNKFIILHDLEKEMNWNSVGNHRIIQNGEIIYSFGGEIFHHVAYTAFSNDIYMFDIKQNVWTKMDVKLPEKKAHVGCISVLNGQYLLLLGGMSKAQKESKRPCKYDDEIWILNVKDKTFKESNVKCPSKGTPEAVSFSEWNKDKLTVSGYVRSEWKIAKLCDHLFPHQYLMKMICTYYRQEFVHLFYVHPYKEKRHYKISVFDILNH